MSVGWQAGHATYFACVDEELSPGRDAAIAVHYARRRIAKIARCQHAQLVVCLDLQPYPRNEPGVVPPFALMLRMGVRALRGGSSRS